MSQPAAGGRFLPECVLMAQSTADYSFEIARAQLRITCQPPTRSDVQKVDVHSVACCITVHSGANGTSMIVVEGRSE